MPIAGVPGSGMSGSPGGHVGLEMLDERALGVIRFVKCQPLGRSFQARIHLFESVKQSVQGQLLVIDWF